MRLRYIIPVIIIITCFKSYLFADTIYQAEEAEVIHMGVIESEHEGYTGTGYVNCENIVGSYIEWFVCVADSGDHTLRIFYATGADQDRKMEITVNGNVEQDSLSFPPTGAWTTWAEQTTSVTLNSGPNFIRITAITGYGPPNIDKMEVSGDVGIPYYFLKLSVFGEGSIIIEPEDSIFMHGTEVFLTATPDSDYIFAGWRGNKRGDEDTIIFEMESTTFISAIFMQKGLYVKTNELVGWASYETGISGGEGGTIVTASTQEQLETYIGSSDKYIIQVQGEIEITPFGNEIGVGSNTTIIGVDPDAVIKGGGLRIGDVSNVIVRNLTFKDAYVTWDGKTTDNDAIEINNSQHVWIDHCDFSHYDDGLVDIKNGADYVTVSWCRFHNHNKVMLIGSVDDNPPDVGHLNTTVHHCWFDGRDGNGIAQRLPRVRYGMVHVFNNYYEDVSIRAVEVGYDGNVTLENNYFKDVKDPHPVVGGATGGDNKLNVSGNIYENSYGRMDTRGVSFTPADFYSYQLNDANDIPVIVMLGSGVGADTAIGMIDTTSVNVNDMFNNMKSSFILEQNYPNPFNLETKITYTVPELSIVKLHVFDMTGKRIANLADETKQAGLYTAIFDGSKLDPGVYIYQLESSGQYITRYMVLIK